MDNADNKDEPSSANQNSTMSAFQPQRKPIGRKRRASFSSDEPAAQRVKTGARRSPQHGKVTFSLSDHSATKPPPPPSTPQTKTSTMCSNILTTQERAFVELQQRIQALPQEMQDEILHQTLLATLPPLQKFDNSMLPHVFHNTPLMITRSEQDYDLSGDTLPTTALDNVRIISENTYKVPTALQINRKTRVKMCEIYYKDSIFWFNSGDRMWFAPCAWAKSLPKAYHLEIYALSRTTNASGSKGEGEEWPSEESWTKRVLVCGKLLIHARKS